jgi:transposase
MRPYSIDLRERVLRAIDAGTPRPEIVRTLGISLATIGRYIRMRRERGFVHPKPYPKRASRLEGTVEQRRALWAQLQAHDHATLEQHCKLWERERDVRVSISTMSRAIRRLGWTYKKRVWEPPSETKKREVLGERV